MRLLRNINCISQQPVFLRILRTSLPKFPSGCVVGGQRLGHKESSRKRVPPCDNSHRIATLLRLADENLFCGVSLDIMQTLH